MKPSKAMVRALKLLNRRGVNASVCCITGRMYVWRDSGGNHLEPINYRAVRRCESLGLVRYRYGWKITPAGRDALREGSR